MGLCHSVQEISNEHIELDIITIDMAVDCPHLLTFLNEQKTLSKLPSPKQLETLDDKILKFGQTVDKSITTKNKNYKFALFPLSILNSNDVTFLLRYCATFQAYKNIGIVRVRMKRKDAINETLELAYYASDLTYRLDIINFEQNNDSDEKQMKQTELKEPVPNVSKNGNNGGNNNDMLCNLADETIQPFTLENEICLGRVLSVYDGDTCTVNMKTSNGVHRWKIRCLGYDCPEIKLSSTKEPDTKLRELHKRHGRTCGNLLRKMIMGRQIIIRCGPFETKWGRLLADLYVPHPKSGHFDATEDDMRDLNNLLHVNKWMLENTTALLYDGGTKQEFNFDLSKLPMEYKTEFAMQ